MGRLRKRSCNIRGSNNYLRELEYICAHGGMYYRTAQLLLAHIITDKQANSNAEKVHRDASHRDKGIHTLGEGVCCSCVIVRCNRLSKKNKKIGHLPREPRIYLCNTILSWGDSLGQKPHVLSCAAPVGRPSCTIPSILTYLQ